MIAPSASYQIDEGLPAVRELLSRHPTAMSNGPKKLPDALCPLSPTLSAGVFEVEAALEALVVVGEIAT